MKVSFILKDARQDAAAPVMSRIFRVLRRRNVEVDLIIPAAQLIDLSSLEIASDLYALRPGVELGLSLAGILHDKGARLVNSFPASEFTYDKARVTALLEAHGIPTPRSDRGAPRQAVRRPTRSARDEATARCPGSRSRARAGRRRLPGRPRP